MEPENVSTLNEGTGGSSTPVEAGGLVSTTDFTSKPAADTDPEKANNIGDAPKNGSPDGKGDAGQGEQADKQSAKEEDGDKLDRFDKHPRFQELRAKAESAEKRAMDLERKVNELLESSRPEVKGDQGQELPYKDISKMTADEILDWQSDDPVAYHNNLLAQAKYELGMEWESRMEAKSNEDVVVKTYQDFASKNPGFDDMWDRGELQAYMQANPGHNTISAYYALTQEVSVNSAVEKAVAEAEKKFAANQKAKRENKSLAGGPQTTGTDSAPVDQELQNTSKFGGPVAVLAKRLAERRRQAGLQ